MPKILLTTRPDYDNGTYYLYHWSKIGLESAEKQGFRIISLERENANKKEFEGRNAKLNPNLIFFNGHGTATTIRGHKGEILIEMGKNDNQFQNRIVYSISCSSGKELGRSIAAKNKTSVFIGYEDDFVLHNDKDMETNPLEDKLAEVFLEHAQILVSAISKGHTVNEAYEKAKDNMREKLIEIFYDPVMAADLYNNYINFVEFGDVDKRAY